MILSCANMKTTRLSTKICGCAEAARGRISKARKASATPARRRTFLIVRGDGHAAAAKRTGHDLLRTGGLHAAGNLALEEGAHLLDQLVVAGIAGGAAAAGEV